MANVNFPSGREGYADARKAGAGSTGIGGSTLQDAEAANFRDVNSMRTRLAAINGTYYTTARLDSMTDNDMVYALRVHGGDTGAGINKSGKG